MNRMFNLLAWPPYDGYPIEYLLARLAARRINFTERCSAGRVVEIWSELQNEYIWIFRQLNNRFRTKLAPVFLYFELRNLYTALRFLADDNRVEMNSIIRQSLLNNQLKSILTRETDLPDTLKELSTVLGHYGKSFKKLLEAWRTGGHSLLEITILQGFAEIIGKEKPLPPIKSFLTQLIERRNLLLLAKEKRWRLKNSPIVNLKNEESSHRKLLLKLNRIERESPGIADNLPGLDIFLVQKILNRSRKSSRLGKASETIVFYLFSCFLTAANCGIKGLSGFLDDSQLAKEVIL